jgi:hypothetical protein
MEISIRQVHREHLLWLNELNFYQDEIKFFQNQIIRLILHHLQEINMERVGEFRQEFFQYLKLIDDFRFQIYFHEKKLAEKSINTEVEDDNDHQYMRQEVTEFEKSFMDLRERFRRFWAKYAGHIG